MMVYFSLGSNLGDRLDYLRNALVSLHELFGTPEKISSVYETEGWGVDNHPAYLNAVVCFQTSMSPEDILTKILIIEKLHGRERNTGSYEPRTLDIDILLYDDVIMKKENLVIPHPLLKYRKFVLLPLCEISGEFIHPEFGISINELLDKCDDESGIWKTQLTLTL
jgi:2-amino-4-hydroxy-6-hydroxymethyldihydropteridine diphosphokinase